MWKFDLDKREHEKDLSSVKYMVQSLNKDGKIIAVSPKWLEKMGFNESEVLGKSFMEFLDDKSLPQVQKNFPHLKDYGFVDNVPLKLVKKDGVVIEAALNGSSLYDDGGSFVKTFCELRTLDFYMNSATHTEQLLEKERLLHTFSNLKGAISSFYTQKYSYEKYLEAVKEVLNEPPEIINLSIEDQNSIEKEFKKISLDKSLQFIFFKIKDDKNNIVNRIVFWVKDQTKDTGKLFFLIDLNVSENIWSLWKDTLKSLSLNIEVGLKNIYNDKILEEKKSELEQIIQLSPNPIIVYNQKKEIVLINNTCIQTLGFNRYMIDTFDKWNKNVLKDQGKNFYEYIARTETFKQKAHEADFKVYTKNGSEFIWQFNTIKIGKSKVLYIMVASDITELKHKEELKVIQSRLTSMGEILSTIAHQWRQPLAIISMSTSNTLMDLEFGNINSEDMKSSLQTITNETMHLSETIENFQNYFNPNTKPVLMDIKKIIQDSFNQLQEMTDENSIKTKLIDNSFANSKTLGYENEILQVFVNIVKNGIESLNKSKIKNPYIEVTINSDEENIIINIYDNGQGIDNQLLNKVFDPYFSTKSCNRNGLGLYMSKVVIEKHMSGILEVIPQKQGVCFRVTLPIKTV